MSDALSSFRSEQFFQMLEADVFPDEARVSLWNGRIVEKTPRVRAQEIACAKFIQKFARKFDLDWFIIYRPLVSAGTGYVLMPDFMILRGEPDDYRDRYPTSSDSGLIVEVSHGNRRHALGAEMACLARAKFLTYWVADLIEGIIIEHTGSLPDERRYASVKTYTRRESIPLMLDDVHLGTIAINDLLPLP